MLKNRPCGNSADMPHIEASEIADWEAFKVFGNDVTLILAQSEDGSLKAFFPSAAAGCAPAFLLAGTRPQQVVKLENTGWACTKVTARTWQCSRSVCGMCIVTTLSV